MFPQERGHLLPRGEPHHFRPRQIAEGEVVLVGRKAGERLQRLCEPRVDPHRAVELALRHGKVVATGLLEVVQAKSALAALRFGHDGRLFPAIEPIADDVQLERLKARVRRAAQEKPAARLEYGGDGPLELGASHETTCSTIQTIRTPLM